MVRRYKGNLRFLEQLLADPEFKAWLEGQPAKIKERWAKVKKIVHDDALNADIDLFLRVLEPVEKMVRLFDGMKGVYIGVAYEALLQYETMLSNPIEGLADAREPPLAARRARTLPTEIIKINYIYNRSTCAVLRRYYAGFWAGSTAQCCVLRTVPGGNARARNFLGGGPADQNNKKYF